MLRKNSYCICYLKDTDLKKIYDSCNSNTLILKIRLSNNFTASAMVILDAEKSRQRKLFIDDQKTYNSLQKEALDCSKNVKACSFTWNRPKYFKRNFSDRDSWTCDFFDTEISLFKKPVRVTAALYVSSDEINQLEKSTATIQICPWLSVFRRNNRLCLFLNNNIQTRMLENSGKTTG